ncbi:hypothetical protein [Streptomyces sp. NPDC017991]|uniref:hypothetical protein n=1 Tax=Streptomyces sp. NPDC017991 TaxID=3365026 RepID=UPI0037965D4D
MGERGGDSTHPDLGALLAGAVRGEDADPDAEKRALAAFRDARDAGAHGAVRTRRRDDWRPAGERRGWSLRATLVALAASVTLGGVAVAAIGSGVGGRDHGGEPDRARRPSSGSVVGGGTPGVSGPGRAGLPSTAQDTEAHCRAYDSVGKRGKALDPAAWQRLVRAAGGEDEVVAYCASQLAGAKEKKHTENSKGTKAAEKAAKAGGSKPAKQSKAPGKGVTKTPKSVKSPKTKKSAKTAKGAKSGSG